MPDRTQHASLLPGGASNQEDESVLTMLATLEQSLSGAPGILDQDAALGLVAWLGHRRKSVRRRAANILATAIRSGAVASALCEDQLDSEDPARRWSAAFTLGRAGRTTPRVIDVALAQFDSADADVRWAAAAIVIPIARVIGELRTRLRGLAEGGVATVRKMALLCLAEAGDRDIALYLRGLDDTDTFVRLAAVKALGRAGDSSPRVVSALRAAAAGDPEARMHRAATAIADRLEAASGRE